MKKVIKLTTATINNSIKADLLAFKMGLAGVLPIVGGFDMSVLDCMKYETRGALRHAIGHMACAESKGFVSVDSLYYVQAAADAVNSLVSNLDYNNLNKVTNKDLSAFIQFILIGCDYSEETKNLNISHYACVKRNNEKFTAAVYDLYSTYAMHKGILGILGTVAFNSYIGSWLGYLSTAYIDSIEDTLLNPETSK